MDEGPNQRQWLNTTLVRSLESYDSSERTNKVLLVTCYFISLDLFKNLPSEKAGYFLQTSITFFGLMGVTGGGGERVGCGEGAILQLLLPGGTDYRLSFHFLKLCNA